MPDTTPLSAQDLKAYREQRGLTQAELADEANKALGRRYDRNRISRWESEGERIPQNVADWVRKRKQIEGDGPSPSGLQSAASSGPAVVLSVVNQKGGVGKTTSTVNIAYLLAKAGQRVLVIDSDAQANATIHFGVQPYECDLAGHTLMQVLFKDVPTAKAIKSVCDGMIDLLPSSISLSGADAEIYKEPNGTLVVREKVEELRSAYDFILIDCAPNLGQLTVAALNASDLILIPSQTEMLSVMGIPMLLENLDKVRRRVNPKIRVLGILPTLHQERRKQNKDMAIQLTDMADQLRLHLFDPVKNAADYSKGVSAGQPTLAFNPFAGGAEAYQQVADALLSARRENTNVG